MVHYTIRIPGHLGLSPYSRSLICFNADRPITSYQYLNFSLCKQNPNLLTPAHIVLASYTLWPMNRITHTQSANRKYPHEPTYMIRCPDLQYSSFYQLPEYRYSTSHCYTQILSLEVKRLTTEKVSAKYHMLDKAMDVAQNRSSQHERYMHSDQENIDTMWTEFSSKCVR